MTRGGAWCLWHKENECIHRFYIGGKKAMICSKAKAACAATVKAGKCPEGKIGPQSKPKSVPIPDNSWNAWDTINTRMKKLEERMDRMERFFT